MALPRKAMQLHDHSDLQWLALRDVTLTGKTIGRGSYGSVEEVAIAGTVCAAKKIHEFLTKTDPSWLAKEVADSNLQKFCSECVMMSRLRHPHIVQFLGLWFESADNSSLYLVMERMMTSLHDLLAADAPSPSSSSQPNLPLGLKCSILQDTALGLAYLHSQDPPVIHRDLSAGNILLDSALTAKIADLGMARILPDEEGATMTKAPGALIYMPPEALEDTTRYNTSIDIFSLGVLVVFVLGEEFPHNLKAPTYADGVKGLMARTELQRRENYTQKIYSAFPRSHPLIRLMETCLDNTHHRRPLIGGVLELLKEALAGVCDCSHTSSKLDLLLLLKNTSDDLQDQKKQSHLELEIMKKIWKDKVEKLRREISTSSKVDKKEVRQVRAKSTGVLEDTFGDGYNDQQTTALEAESPPPLPTRKESLQIKGRERMESWYRNVSREEALRLLTGCETGTFLCRPSSLQALEPGGGVHTHTIEVVSVGGIKHIKVIFHNNTYGLSIFEEFKTLMELVIYYSQHSLHAVPPHNYLRFPCFREVV